MRKTQMQGPLSRAPDDSSMLKPGWYWRTAAGAAEIERLAHENVGSLARIGDRLGDQLEED